MPFREATVYKYEGIYYIVPMALTIPAAGPLAFEIAPVYTANLDDAVGLGNKICDALKQSVERYEASSYKDLPPTPLIDMYGRKWWNKFTRECVSCSVELVEKILGITPYINENGLNGIAETDMKRLLDLPASPEQVGRTIMEAIADAATLTAEYRAKRRR